MTVLGFAVARTNDDYGGSLNSQFVLRPTDSGIIYIRARSLGLSLGRMQLSVTEGEPPPAPPAP